MGTQVQVLSFSNSLPLHPSYFEISPWRNPLLLSLRVFHFRCVRGLLSLSLFVFACLCVLVVRSNLCVHFALGEPPVGSGSFFYSHLKLAFR